MTQKNINIQKKHSNFLPRASKVTGNYRGTTASSGRRDEKQNRFFISAKSRPSSSDRFNRRYNKTRRHNVSRKSPQ